MITMRNSLISPSCFSVIPHDFALLVPQKIKTEVFEILKMNVSTQALSLKSFSNKNFHIQNVEPDFSNYVLRIPDALSNFFSSRANEKKNLESAFLLGVCPLEIQYFDEKTGVMVTNFIKDCIPLSSNSFSNIELRKQAIQHLKLIHNSNMPFQNSFSRFFRLAKMNELLNEFVKDSKFFELYSILKENDAQISEDHFVKVPCHNDPSPENFILKFGKMYTLDWENSALNDPMWDLAHFSAILILSAEEEECLLNFYNPEDFESARDKCYYFKPFIHLASAAWALYHLETKNFVCNEELLKKIYDERIELSQNLFINRKYQDALMRLKTH